MGHLLGEGRIWAYNDQFPILKIPSRSLGNNFPRDAVDTPPKWPSQISFLNPSRLVDLCTKLSLLPAYSRLLWVPAPSSPSKGGNKAPSSTLPGGFLLLTWALSSPAAAHYLLMWKVRALRSRILPEGRGAFPPPPRRFELQSLGVASNETCLHKVRSFPTNAPNVIATLSGKQTHSEEQYR